MVKPANFLVVGATNRAADLDPALLRPGRFDKTIRVDVPSRSGRREIIDYYLARKAHAPELDDPGQAGRLVRVDLRLFAGHARASSGRSTGLGAPGRAGRR